MSWLEKLQQRWNVSSLWQVMAILQAFACTGFTEMWLMKPLLLFFFGKEIPLWGKILYYVLILPIYNLILLGYGFVVGQFRFFVEFEKRMFKRVAWWLRRIIIEPWR
jgi:hypothetical protein